jgi:hypothetical protein
MTQFGRRVTKRFNETNTQLKTKVNNRTHLVTVGADQSWMQRVTIQVCLQADLAKRVTAAE